MTKNKTKSIALYFLIPGAVLVTPGALYLLYKACEALICSIMLTLQKGEIGSVCFMFGMAGLVLLFIGGLLWVESDEYSGYDMWWYLDDF